MRISAARASSSSGSGLPSIASARASSFSSASASSGLNTSTRARESSARVELEGRVLGRGADQRDGAVLHDRQEGVLLRAVEAMDLVDEQQRPLPRLAPRARRSKTFLRSATPEKIAEICSKCRSVSSREQPRHRGLAGARRPPEDERAERAGLQHAGERAVGAEQMVLPDDIGEPCGRSRSASGRGASRQVPPPRRGWSARARARRRSSAEHHRHLLAAALDRDAPQPASAWPASARGRGCVAIFSLLTAITRRRAGSRTAGPASRLSISTITTPSADGSRRSSSASAGERFGDLAPVERRARRR